MPMMLLAVIIALQQPTLQQEPPKPSIVQRVWKPSQRDRYKVSLVIHDDGGETKSEFTMEFQAPKTISDPSKVDIEVGFRDATTYFGKIKKSVKSAGTARLLFRSTGLPANLLAKEQAASVMLPLFGWALPDEVGTDGKFSITGYRTDDQVVVAGVGAFTVEKEAKVTADWTLVYAGKSFATLATTSFFDPKNGRLLRSDGKLTAKQGTAEYTVR